MGILRVHENGWQETSADNTDWWVFFPFAFTVRQQLFSELLVFHQLTSFFSFSDQARLHRCCKWHVLKKAKESMGTLWSKKSDFKSQFDKLVHQMVTEEEFEGGWGAMLDKYSLKKHPFITQIYEVRHKWATPYFRGVFCAKMTSTQRSESANHFLKGYVPPGCPMHLFLKQYEKLQFDRDSEESFQEKRTSLVS